jgi:hypothetical protein
MYSLLASSQPISSLTSQAPGIKSVILLAHGLDGSVKDFSVIQEAIASDARIDTESTLVLNPDCNRGKTYDGIANGANRLYDYLMEETSSIPPGPIQLSVMVCF